MLEIYNTLTRKKEPFIPIEPGRVRIYVCGMTVYDYCHLGHARVLVAFDVVVRHLRASGFDVTYVRNITDIDDKIIQRAGERGESVTQLTERYIEAMHEDADQLGVLRPDLEPRATDSIEQITAMIAQLERGGFAYQGENGDVYFSVSSFPGYGALSGKRPDELRAGARVEVASDKADPLDFVLWKSARAGEPSWHSAWGAGRPGWHIECSAMSCHHLGQHFDIHGGGMDLQFPHHENEIAQSEGANGSRFVNYWMHNGFVRINEEKMSKSLGNFFTVREVLQRYRAEEVRYFILTSHYRSPLNYSDEQLDQARGALTRLYTALRGIVSTEPTDDDQYQQRFVAAMDDDFNTPEALAILFELAHEINRLRDQPGSEAALLAGRLLKIGGQLGLLTADPEEWLQGAGGSGDQGLTDEEIEQLIADRAAARERRDWAEADRIRDLFKEHKIVLEDSSEGTRWRRD